MLSGGNMAKRLTDTTKWKNPTFRKLPSKYKILYLYLLDECDNAGIMYLDLDLLSFTLGETYSLDEFMTHLGHTVVFVATDKIVMRGFIGYQRNDNNVTMRKHIHNLFGSNNLLDRYNNGDFN